MEAFHDGCLVSHWSDCEECVGTSERVLLSYFHDLHLQGMKTYKALAGIGHLCESESPLAEREHTVEEKVRR